MTRLQIGRDLVLDSGLGASLVASDESDEQDAGVGFDVTNEDDGRAGLVLDEDEVRQLRDYLSEWLVALEASR